MQHIALNHLSHDCVPLQADEWLAPGMGERFGPFSECAKQHVAVKPQKGELLSKSISIVKPSMLQHLRYL